MLDHKNKVKSMFSIHVLLNILHIQQFTSQTNMMMYCLFKEFLHWKQSFSFSFEYIFTLVFVSFLFFFFFFFLFFLSLFSLSLQICTHILNLIASLGQNDFRTISFSHSSHSASLSLNKSHSRFVYIQIW